MGVNFGFTYEGTEYDFVDIASVTDNIMPHGEELEHTGCGGNKSPTDDELTKRGNFDIQLRQIPASWVEWQTKIDEFNFKSAEAMQIDNFNGVEEGWNTIIDNLQRLTDSLTVARSHIMLYKDEWRERHRICNSAGWWRDARDSNRELNNEVKAELSFAQQQRARAIALESGELPNTDWDEGANGDTKSYSATEEKLILVGKILLGILAVYLGYRLVKKFRK
jgi:hypothetical protein